MMANVYVEARPKGRLDGTSIDDYVVEDHADHELVTFRIEKKAIDWAKGKGPSTLVALPASERQEEAGPLAAGVTGDAPPPR